MHPIALLGEDRRAELCAFLAKDPAQNLYLLGLLEAQGMSGPKGAPTHAFFGQGEAGALTAVAFVGRGGFIIPCAAEPRSAAALGAFLAGQLQLRAAMGERSAVDSLVKAMGGPAPRQVRDQELFCASADDLGPFVTNALVLATPADLPELISVAAAATKESLGRDLASEDPAGFQRRVQSRVQAKRTYLMRKNGKIVFNADIGPKSRYGAEVEIVYTVPEARKQGLGTLALGQLARSLLSSMPRLTLRGTEQDGRMASLCARVGFVPVRSQRYFVAQ